MSRRLVFIIAAAAAALLSCAAILVVVLVLVVSRDDDGDGLSARCEMPSRSKLEDISAGLDSGLNLGTASAVKSRDFERVWMIAAVVEPDGDVGVWASNSRATSGLIYAVNAAARSHSDWGVLPGVRSGDDGIDESIACVNETKTTQ